MLGERGNGGPLGSVEFDAVWRGAEQHRHHAITTSAATDGARIAVDQHDFLLLKSARPGVAASTKVTLDTATDSFGGTALGVATRNCPHRVLPSAT